MMEYALVLAIGLAGGILGGFFGVGGGILIVPALVLLLPVDQHTAIGTSLAALLPPVGLLGAYEYYKHDHVNVAYAALLALGILLGAYFGARIAVDIAGPMLRKAFAVFLILVSIRLLMR